MVESKAPPAATPPAALTGATQADAKSGKRRERVVAWLIFGSYL